MKNKPTIFYIVRHGQAVGNVTGEHIGHRDDPLTELGREQVKELLNIIGGVHFDAIYSSDLQRAKETSEILNDHFKLPIDHSEQLRERRSDTLRGKKWTEIFELLATQAEEFNELPKEEKMHYRFTPDTETAFEAATRSTNELINIAKNHPGKTILVVCHAGLIGNFLIHHGHHEFMDLFGAAKMSNGGYIKLSYSIEDGFKVLEKHGFESE